MSFCAAGSLMTQALDPRWRCLQLPCMHCGAGANNAWPATKITRGPQLHRASAHCGTWLAKPD